MFQRNKESRLQEWNIISLHNRKSKTTIVSLLDFKQLLIWSRLDFKIMALIDGLIVMSPKISLGPTLDECEHTRGHIIEASSPIETNINVQKSLKREGSSCENNPTNPTHLFIIEDSKHSTSELLNFFHLQCIRPFRDLSLSLLQENHRQICHRWIWWSCYPHNTLPTSLQYFCFFPTHISYG